MDKTTAENIGKTARALKHWNKVLSEIDKKGSASIKLNCTGSVLDVQKNDAVYLQLQATRARLIQELGSYEIVQKATSQRSLSRRFAPAPFGASSTALSDEEMAELKRQKSLEYYYAHREEILEKQRQRYAGKKSTKK